VSYFLDRSRAIRTIPTITAIAPVMAQKALPVMKLPGTHPIPCPSQTNPTPIKTSQESHLVFTISGTSYHRRP
jgi:hypothetical protein